MVLSAGNFLRSFFYFKKLDYVANKRLTLQAGLGLLKTEIRRATLEPTLRDNDFERAPGVTATIGARVEPVDGLVVSVQGRYSDGYYSDDLNTAALRVGSYFLGNAQISYQWGPARLFALATNVFDKAALVQRFGNDTANVTDPREYNLGIELRF